ncbi:MAG: response regulator [Deltaproteobacteria bacterium]|nr:response regulator [Deltaproteobacteria bacterium]
MNASNTRVLVVDDNADDRALVTRALHRAIHNVNVEAVEDEQQLIPVLDKYPFDLVITDYYLRKIDGFRVIEHVRARTPRCPVVMFTGTGNEEVAVRALKAGADDYITKSPLHYARLAAAVQVLLERDASRARAEKLERRLDSLLDRLSVGVFRATATGRIVEANPSLWTMLGCDGNCTAERLYAQRTVAQLLRVDQGQQLIDELEAGGRFEAYAVQVRRLDGDTRRVSISFVLGEPFEGEPTIAGHLEDVTLLEEARAAAEVERERLQATLRSIRDGIVAIGDDGRVLLTNDVGQQYLDRLATVSPGGRVSTLGGRPVGDLFALPPEGELGHELVVEGEPPSTFEVAAQPIRRREVPGGWVFTIRDVSEYREQQERMQRQSKLAAVGELATGIAHDFNNTLQLITSIARLLEMDAKSVSADQIVEYSGHIVEGAMQASRVVRQVLDFSRESPSAQQRVDLRRLVVGAMVLLRRGVPENIEFTLDATQDEHWAECDAAQIQQVMTNLVVNARDAMDLGGRLRIVLSDYVVEPGQPAPQVGMKPGRWHSMAVHDTGVGIPQSVRGHIFRPFFTTKRELGGTGLGLAQVSGIVDKHGGHITVESQVGRGSCVTVHLPASSRGGAGQARAQVEAAPARGNGELLMIVEDDEGVLFAHTTLFEALGYTVVTARNGREALGAYHQYRTRLRVVVTDMVMPQMGGLELVRALRRCGCVAKVVVLTGYQLSAQWRQVWGDDVVDVLVKPLKTEKLARTIQYALRLGEGQALHG